MVSTDGVWVEPRDKREAAYAARAKFVARDGDHLTLLALWRAFSAVPRQQARAWCHDNFVNVRWVLRGGHAGAGRAQGEPAVCLVFLACQS